MNSIGPSIIQGMTVPKSLESVQESGSLTNKLIPAHKVDKHFWKSLKERALMVADHDDGSGSVRVLDILSLACDPSNQKYALHPSLFSCLQEYYKSEKISVSDSSQLSEMAIQKAQEVASTMQNMAVYPELCCKLGSYIESVFQRNNLDTSFLDKEMLVLPGSSTIDPKINEEMKTSMKKWLKGHGYKRDEVELRKLKDSYSMSTYPAILSQQIPEANWVKILTEAMTEMGEECNLGIDFSKMPIFFNYIEQEIANPIMKSSTFMDHPCSGAFMHGMPIHSMQRLFAKFLGLLDNDSFGVLVDSNLFGQALDLEAYIHDPTPLIESETSNQIIALINYQGILDGKIPTSLQVLLTYGLISKILSKAVSDFKLLPVSLKLLGLDESQDKEEDIRALQRNLRSIRALEYTVAGITSFESDRAANALAHETRDVEIKCLKDLLLKYEGRNWYNFHTDAVALNMQKGVVRSYIESDDYHVYQEVKVKDKIKLKRLTNMDDYNPKVGKLAYPADAKPPEECMASV